MGKEKAPGIDISKTGLNVPNFDRMIGTCHKLLC
jgi:hypothetical protein